MTKFFRRSTFVMAISARVIGFSECAVYQAFTLAKEGHVAGAVSFIRPSLGALPQVIISWIKNSLDVVVGREEVVSV